MTKYIYVKVLHTAVWSTDPTVLDWLLATIKKFVPTVATRAIGQRSLSAGVPYEVQFYKLQDKDDAVGHLIHQLLCEQGFQPFAAVPHPTTIQTVFTHYRKAIEK